MRERMLKKLVNALGARKAVFVVALFALTLLVSFIPVHVADAQGELRDFVNSINPLNLAWSWFGDKFGDIASGFGDVLANIIVTILTFVPAMLFFAMAGLANWIIGIVLNIGIIPGAETEILTPKFVAVGWEFTRGLVNALLILVLVFIGLATMLRLQNYQLKKTLPSLLIVALLVNFSAVFVGFIVDMGNLISNFFLNAAGELGVEALKSIFTTGNPVIGGLGLGQSIAYGLVMFIFYIVASLIFFIIFLLFLVRTVVLWTLVILAPLAFASYILPATRGMLWNQWLKQTILWSIIGIPIGFFLYLSNLVLRGGDLFGSSPNLTSEASFLSGLLASVLSPIVGLLLLAIGVVFSLQFAPAGANRIVSLGAKVGKGAGLAAGTSVWRFRAFPEKRISKRVPLLGGMKLGFDRGIGQGIEGFGIRLRRGAQLAGLSKEKREQRQGELQKTIDRKMAERPELSKKLADKHSTDEEKLEANEALAKNRSEVEGLEEEKERLANPSRAYKMPGIMGLGTRAIARWAGRGLELGTGGITTRVKARDEREIAEGKAEGINKDALDNVRKMNQEFAKGRAANMNRIIGLLGAIVANTDSDDLQEYIREGIVDGEKIGGVIMEAQRRGGPPAYRPLMKALEHRMIENPDQFGSNFASVKENGNIQRMADGNTPVMQSEVAQAMINEVVEKIQQGEIANKILGDAIDAGKAGGVEFFEHGGRRLVELLMRYRGGDLAPGLIRRPESREGRAEILNLIKSISPEKLHEWGADGLMTWMASTTAQGAGVTAPLNQGSTRRLIDLLAQRDREPDNFAEGSELKNQLDRLIATWQAGAEQVASTARAASEATDGSRSGPNPLRGGRSNQGPSTQGGENPLRGGR